MSILLRLGSGLALGLCSMLAMANTSIESDRWKDSYDAHFKKYAKRYFGPDFDWRWFKAQAIAESHLRPTAISSVGAKGLMQLMPATYGDIRKQQPHFGDLSDPQWNIAAGIFYDRQIFRKWRGLPEQERIYLTLASYNAGYARVRRAYNKVATDSPSWEQVKQYLPGETRAYVARIRQLMDNDQQAPRKLRLAHLFAYAN